MLGQNFQKLARVVCRALVRLCVVSACSTSHLAGGGVFPSRCSSCSAPRPFVSPGRASARFAQHRGERCSCDSAQWPPYKTGHPAWKIKNKKWQRESGTSEKTWQVRSHWKKEERTLVIVYIFNNSLIYSFFRRGVSLWKVAQNILGRQYCLKRNYLFFLWLISVRSHFEWQNPFLEIWSFGLSWNSSSTKFLTLELYVNFYIGNFFSQKLDAENPGWLMWSQFILYGKDIK